MKDAKIIIVGAGLGGLTAACCLIRAGFDVEVYEQAPVLAEVGAGIQISANPMHVLADLGLKDKIMAVGVRPGAYVFRLHDTGEELQRFNLAADHERMHGQPYNQIHRADLHEIIAAKAMELKPNVVTLNKRATGALRGRLERQGRRADRRRWPEVGGARANRRQRAGDLHRRWSLAHHCAHRASEEAAPGARYELVLGAGRTLRVLLPAQRRAAELRWLHRDRRRLGGVLDRPLPQGEAARGPRGLASRGSGDRRCRRR
jgi:2-polyprenyl-6-methoxyphenol hydroxylase-like FAD-dependent oxidoreductase